MASTSESPAGQAFFDRIPATGDNEAAKCKALYDEWAASYDGDLTHASQGYVAPAQAARVLKSLISICDGLQILDAGCGTGLSGIAVKDALGKGTLIDGLDISPGMLAVASKTGVYRRLQEQNLAEPIALEAGTYDAVVCVGTMTAGHVG